MPSISVGRICPKNSSLTSSYKLIVSRSCRCPTALLYRVEVSRSSFTGTPISLCGVRNYVVKKSQVCCFPICETRLAPFSSTLLSSSTSTASFRTQSTSSIELSILRRDSVCRGEVSPRSSCKCSRTTCKPQTTSHSWKSYSMWPTERCNSGSGIELPLSIPSLERCASFCTE